MRAGLRRSLQGARWRWCWAPLLDLVLALVLAAPARAVQLQPVC